MHNRSDRAFAAVNNKARQALRFPGFVPSGPCLGSIQPGFPGESPMLSTGCAQHVNSLPTDIQAFSTACTQVSATTASSRHGGDRAQPPAGIAFFKPRLSRSRMQTRSTRVPRGIYPQAAHSIFTACTPLSGAFPQLFNRGRSGPRLALG